MEKAVLIQVSVIGLSDNFSYLVYDKETKKGAVIDPSGDFQKVIDVVEKEKVKVEYVITTHAHMDHIEGNSTFMEKYKAKLVAHETSSLNPDVKVKDNDVLKLGNTELKFLYTPGHSSDAICILIEDSLISADTLFVGAIGRADLPGSDVEKLYESLQRLMTLDDDIKVYPGHDYGESPSSTIGHEKKTNPYLLCKTKEEFQNLRM